MSWSDMDVTRVAIKALTDNQNMLEKQVEELKAELEKERKKASSVLILEKNRKLVEKYPELKEKKKAATV